ncbi:MAG: hypothetical protein AAB387_10875, partial [candidate division NC10 bacterium]
MRLRVVGGAVAFAAVLALARLGWQVTTPTRALEAGARGVEIPANQGILSIAGALERAEVVRSRTGFVLWSVALGS